MADAAAVAAPDGEVVAVGRGHALLPNVKWENEICKHCASIVGEIKFMLLSQQYYFRVPLADGTIPNGGPCHKRRRLSVDGGVHETCRDEAIKWLHDHRKFCG